jgi:S1-C subfamily serine protease
VQLTARREFAGYWEYVLDDALFTSPAHPNWGGAALLGADGRLCGIGSLYLDRIMPEVPDVDGNMSIPIDLLKPIMEELLMYGRTLKPARPWLGMFVSEVETGLMIAGVYQDAPATVAGLRAGDLVVEIGGKSASGLSALFRTLWAIGPAGSEIPIRIERDGETLDMAVHSVDRRDFWKSPNIH